VWPVRRPTPDKKRFRDSGHSWLVDDVSLTALTQDDVIPEPLTLAMLGLAGAGLGGYLRRRR
jgi:hypothetical protein